MKRISYWILSTVSALVLLFSYHTSTSGVLPTASSTAVYSSQTTGAAASTTGSGASTQPSAKPTAKSTAKSTTVTGQVIDTQWGPVQVALDVSGGRITAVKVLQYPTGNGRDEQINSYALPILIRETMDSQSAQIDMVSGATVTSTGYLGSLQSALDQAHL